MPSVALPPPPFCLASCLCRPLRDSVGWEGRQHHTPLAAGRPWPRLLRDQPLRSPRGPRALGGRPGDGAELPPVPGEGQVAHQHPPEPRRRLWGQQHPPLWGRLPAVEAGGGSWRHHHSNRYPISSKATEVGLGAQHEWGRARPEGTGGGTGALWRAIRAAHNSSTPLHSRPLWSSPRSRTAAASP